MQAAVTAGRPGDSLARQERRFALALLAPALAAHLGILVGAPDADGP